MPEVLVLRPEQDGPEQIMSLAWGTPIMHRLSPDSATTLVDPARPIDRQAVDQALKAGQVVLYFGRGERDSLGQGPLLIDSSNVGDVAGGIILAFACHSAKELGPTAIQNGINAYLGFDDWLFVYRGPVNAVAAAVFDAAVSATSGVPMEAVFEKFADALNKIFVFYEFHGGRANPDAPLIAAAAVLMRRTLKLLSVRSIT